MATAAGPMYGQRIPVSTPTTVMALLQFRSGAHISMTMSWDVWRHGHNPIEIYGTEGSMRLADPDRFGGVVSFTRAGGAWQEVDSGAMPLGTANWRSPRARPDAPASANYRGVGVADLARASGPAGRTAALHGLPCMSRRRWTLSCPPPRWAGRSIWKHPSSDPKACRMKRRRPCLVRTPHGFRFAYEAVFPR